MLEDIDNQKILERDSRLRHDVLLMASVLAVTYGIWFSIENIWITNYRLAVIDLVVTFIFSAVGIWSYRRYESAIPRYISVASCCMFFFYLYATGGVSSMGALWSFLIPPIVFFLTGYRSGLIISIVYLTGCFITVVFNEMSPGFLHVYHVDFLKRFVGVYVFLIIIASGYEYHKARSEALLIGFLNAAHRANIQTNESEAKYRTLFEGSGYGIVIADIEHATILEVSPVAAEMFGYTCEEMRGMSVEGLHPEDKLLEYMHAFRMNAELPRSHVTQLECLRSGRSLFYADIHTVLMTLEKQKRVVGFFADVTRRVQAESELVQSRKKADSASEAKSAFLANMSHEIRTPMHGINGMIEVLLQTNLSDEQKKYAEIIRDSSNSLLVLISDILDISKIESGKMDVERIEFDLISLVRGVIEQMRHKASLKGLAYNIVVDESLPGLVIGDPAKLRQILLNLIDNAVKFTNEGTVVVSISQQSQRDDNCFIRFEVKDSGIGIPKEKISQLFQSFTQLDSSLTRRYSGTGLGLAISRKLTSLMGGDIGVSSNYGRGSQFWFVLPLQIVMRASALEHRRGEMPSSGHLSFMPVDPALQNPFYALLAEDNPVNQFVVKAMLNKLGISVDVVANGHEAILALSKRRYDILLLDLQMPLLDGFDTIKLLRNNQSANFDRSIPAIAVTADAFPETMAVCLKAGMNDCLIKPFKLSDLSQIINKWLPTKS